MTPKQQQIFELLLLAHDRKQGVEITFKSEEIARSVRQMIYKLRRRILRDKGPNWEKLAAMVLSLDGPRLTMVKSDLDTTCVAVIDKETGENITGVFDFLDDTVEIDEEEMKLNG